MLYFVSGDLNARLLYGDLLGKFSSIISTHKFKNHVRLGTAEDLARPENLETSRKGLRVKSVGNE